MKPLARRDLQSWQQEASKGPSTACSNQDEGDQGSTHAPEGRAMVERPSAGPVGPSPDDDIYAFLANLLLNGREASAHHILTTSA